MFQLAFKQVRCGVVALACSAWLALPAASAHRASFTLEQIMDVPFPSGLQVAGNGNSVAWVFDVKGCRNIWVAERLPGTSPADRPLGQARQVTSFTQDEGFDIAELAWSADGRMITFTRGGDLEDERPANVNNSPEGPSPREVWIVSTTGGSARKVAVGHSATFSPDGSRLVFIDKGHILTAPVNGNSDAQPLIVDQGTLSSVTWSPDATHFAFISHRGNHSLLGVYNFADKSIVWQSPSLDEDSAAVFSPRGSQIAFIRVPAESAPPFISRRAGEPWSIWVTDALSGHGRRVWRADNGSGSVFQPTLSRENLLWTAHDQLVFPWEKTGWLQLYGVAARGGAARALTSGEFEVMHMALSNERKRLVFSSNQDDSDRLHVWALDPDHGPPTRIGTDRGIEDYPQVSNDGTIFALQSDATRPLQPVMLTSGRWQPLAPQTVPSSFPTAKLVTPEVVTFAAKDGHQAHAQIFLPQGVGASKPHAAILFFHGGPRRQMMVGFHPMDAYNWMYALNQYFAAQGYVVLSVNYRGGIGYGLDYREADDFGPGGGSELNDLLGAVAYLQSRKDVDKARLGIWGGSYGGLMTALGLARASDSIAAGVDYAGVYNWATFLASVGAPVDGGDATRRAVESSPVATVDKWRSPVLIVQADDDRSVPSAQASELIEGLRAHHVEHDTIVMPNEIHDLIRHASWMTLFNAADEYFERKLQPAH